MVVSTTLPHNGRGIWNIPLIACSNWQQVTHQRYNSCHFPQRCNADLTRKFINIEFLYPLYYNRVKSNCLYNDSCNTCQQNLEAISATGFKMWLEPNTEDIEQVATRTIHCYCCTRNSNCQHTLNFGDWPKCTGYPLNIIELAYGR